MNLECTYFNQHLSRPHKTIECSFGILYSKWRILSKSIRTDEKTADKIIIAICILQNVIIDMEGFERNFKEIRKYFNEGGLRFRPQQRAGYQQMENS